ncbi:MAG TPA: PfkB family carbohydrate kinase [Mycobacteriales bacterium]|nr:PfkB family carbohydrate kinase [Mycobacteriales bacterium]
MGVHRGRPRILCVGTAAIDTIAVVPTMPLRDSRVTSPLFRTAGGGPAATAAVTIARLGLPVEFCGVVGRDEIGDAAVAGLVAAGVGVHHVERRADITTAQSMILICADDASRTIITQPAPPPRALPTGFDWIHLDHAGYPALSSELRRSATVSLDDGNAVDNLDLHGLDLYVPTAEVVRRRFTTDSVAASAARARAAGAATVVVTDGGAGASLHTEAGSYASRAFGVEVNSTLGAGDVFHGALVAGLANGRDARSAVDYANACAALSCRAIDGQSGIPSPAEVAALLQSPAFAAPPGECRDEGVSC